MDQDEGPNQGAWDELRAGLDAIGSVLEASLAAFGPDVGERVMSSTTRKRLGIRALQGLRTSKSQLAALSKNVSDLERSGRVWQTSMSLSSKSHRELMEQLDSTMRELQNTSGQLRACQAERTAAVGDLENLKQQLSRAESELHATAVTLEQQRAELERAQFATNEAQVHVSELVAENDALGRGAHEATRRANDAVAGLDAARAEAEKARAAAERHQKTVAKLTADNLNFMMELRRCQSDLAAADQERAALKLAVEEQRGPWFDEVRQGVESRVREALARAEQLERQSEAQRAKHAAAVAAAAAEKADLEEYLQRSRAEGEEARAAAEQAQEERARAESEAESARQEAAQLQQQTQHLLAEQRVLQEADRARRAECNERWATEQAATARAAALEAQLQEAGGRASDLLGKLQQAREAVATQQRVNAHLMRRKEEVEWQLMAALAAQDGGGGDGGYEAPGSIRVAGVDDTHGPPASYPDTGRRSAPGGNGTAPMRSGGYVSYPHVPGSPGYWLPSSVPLPTNGTGGFRVDVPAVPPPGGGVVGGSGSTISPPDQEAMGSMGSPMRKFSTGWASYDVGSGSVYPECATASAVGTPVHGHPHMDAAAHFDSAAVASLLASSAAAAAAVSMPTSTGHEPPLPPPLGELPFDGLRSVGELPSIELPADTLTLATTAAAVNGFPPHEPLFLAAAAPRVDGMEAATSTAPAMAASAATQLPAPPSQHLPATPPLLLSSHQLPLPTTLAEAQQQALHIGGSGGVLHPSPVHPLMMPRPLPDAVVTVVPAAAVPVAVVTGRQPAAALQLAAPSSLPAAPVKQMGFSVTTSAPAAYGEPATAAESALSRHLHTNGLAAPTNDQPPALQHVGPAAAAVTSRESSNQAATPEVAVADATALPPAPRQLQPILHRPGSHLNVTRPSTPVKSVRFSDSGDDDSRSHSRQSSFSRLPSTSEGAPAPAAPTPAAPPALYPQRPVKSTEQIAQLHPLMAMMTTPSSSAGGHAGNAAATHREGAKPGRTSSGRSFIGTAEVTVTHAPAAPGRQGDSGR